MPPLVLVEREGAAEVEQWLQRDVSDVDRLDWWRRYLEASAPRQLHPHDPFAEAAFRRFGRVAADRAFWRDLSAPARAAVQRWLFDRTLVQALGEGPRTAFWRRFLPWIRNITPEGERSALLLEFDSCFAVQFIASGRATYFFDRSKRYRFGKLTESQLYRRVLESQHLGRYEHRGSYWEYYAEFVVKSVLGGGGASS
jgi:hypothetical protein